jgi:hypothetical protein
VTQSYTLRERGVRGHVLGRELDAVAVALEHLQDVSLAIPGIELRQRNQRTQRERRKACQLPHLRVVTEQQHRVVAVVQLRPRMLDGKAARQLQRRKPHAGRFERRTQHAAELHVFEQRVALPMHLQRFALHRIGRRNLHADVWVVDERAHEAPAAQAEAAVLDRRDDVVGLLQFIGPLEPIAPVLAARRVDLREMDRRADVVAVQELVAPVARIDDPAVFLHHQRELGLHHAPEREHHEPAVLVVVQRRDRHMVDARRQVGWRLRAAQQRAGAGHLRLAVLQGHRRAARIGQPGDRHQRYFFERPVAAHDAPPLAREPAQ